MTPIDLRLPLNASKLTRLRSIVVDLFKYGAASACALALDAATLLLLNKVFDVDYLVAAAVGFIAGLALIYVLSVRYVFSRHRTLRPSQEAMGFLVTGLIGLFLTEALMKIFVGHLGLPVGFAKIPTAGLVFLFNFTARRSLLFSQKPAPHQRVRP